MAFSSVEYTADGVQVDYTIPFNYLDRDHIVVQVDKVRTDNLGSSHYFTFVNDTTVRVRTITGDNPVANGGEVAIYRLTPISTPAVVFGGGSSLTSANLNKNSEYLTFALQEATDDNDAFLKLYLGPKGAAPAVDNSGDTLQVGAIYFNTNDNTPYYWTGSAWNKGDLADITEGFKDAAESARDAAVIAQGLAEDARDAAANSESAADADRIAAEAAALAAANSETAAGLSEAAADADRIAAQNAASAASSSETNAGNSETAAQSAKGDAEAARDAAQLARDAAQSARDDAQLARDAAQLSESNASQSEINAAASLDEFTDLYLGAKASEPSLDNDGDPLQSGAFYYNTVTERMNVYDGSVWRQLVGGGGLFRGDNGETGDAVNGPKDIIRVHTNTLSTNVTINSGENAMAAGPLEVASGVTLTVSAGGGLAIV